LEAQKKVHRYRRRKREYESMIWFHDSRKLDEVWRLLSFSLHSSCSKSTAAAVSKSFNLGNIELRKEFIWKGEIEFNGARKNLNVKIWPVESMKGGLSEGASSMGAFTDDAAEKQ
jgi:hypothetical protein